MTLPERLALRLEVEEFLVEEAAILDEWRLDDWLAVLRPPRVGISFRIVDRAAGLGGRDIHVPVVKI